MSYIPHTADDIQAMLETIGLADVEELFTAIPEAFRFPTLDLPEGLSQMETSQAIEYLSEANLPAGKMITFLGAGAYNHYSPAVVNQVLLRGEFLTAYTPYQPEISQGTLQAIFEYQSMICALTAMEVANASHYDGATALAEAVILALNAARDDRKKVVLSGVIHPEYREVVRTYTQGMGLTIEGDEPASADLNTFIDAIDDQTALAAIQYPNFFGQIDDIARFIQAAHAHGALACIVADPIALGLLKPPGAMGADIVVGEGQGLGIPMSFGGPYLGFFATRQKYVRKMAGRLVGETTDAQGQTGYVLTLSTREQHIRREKATSNICTNQGLMALAAAVYLSVMGKHGLRKVAELCYHKSHYAADVIDRLDGYNIDRHKPFFKEFVVQCPRPVAEINRYLLETYGIIGGYDLESPYPDRKNQMLIAVTEMNTREEIDLLAQALNEVEQ
ncbi:MAG: aminomethyl-transferring glycine dehydrogenase subunit GcvPA [Anaerolineae bacterium]|nr:aminomethyl-transferring glycine dehydrogenase subunit GcvPA [Anaerolineae bacterium]